MRPPLRAASYEALFGLLAVSGMRIGEALALQRDYVDLTAGVITIADAKGSRPRVVPLHASATEALTRYAVRRDDLCSKPRSRAFFLSAAGAALTCSRVHAAFVKLTSQIGLRTATVAPRIHHLRHSFAVRTLVDLQTSGAEVAGWMPALSDYLGHANPAGTWSYLSASPELMQLAARRFHTRFGGQP